MIRRPPRSTRNDTLFPYTTLFRSHQVQRLHHVGAVLAGQRKIGLEFVIAVEIADLSDNCLVQLDGMAANLQQRQHERSELVTNGNSGKTHNDIRTAAIDAERRFAFVVATLRWEENTFEVQSLMRS